MKGSVADAEKVVCRIFREEGAFALVEPDGSARYSVRVPALAGIRVVPRLRRPVLDG